VGAVRAYRGPFGPEQAERLLWRAGFGPKHGQAKRLAKLGLDGAVLSLTRPPKERLTGPRPHDDKGRRLAPADAYGHDHLWWLDRRAAGLAEQARELYEQVGDRRSLARILNNLGGLNWLLGRTEVAFELLRDAFDMSTEVGSNTDAAQAISSLAQVLLGDGQPEQAETAARHAIELLDGREDYLEETGNATLVLGRALFAQGRNEDAETAVLEAEALFTKVSATSAVAAALVVRGDIRRTLGEVDEAADLYRRAADSLHDYRF